MSWQKFTNTVSCSDMSEKNAANALAVFALAVFPETLPSGLCGTIWFLTGDLLKCEGR